MFKVLYKKKNIQIISQTGKRDTGTDANQQYNNKRARVKQRIKKQDELR